MKLKAKDFFELYRLQDENKQLMVVNCGDYYTLNFIYNNENVILSSSRHEMKRFKTLDALYKEVSRYLNSNKFTDLRLVG